MIKFKYKGSDFMSKEKSVCFTGHRVVGKDFNLEKLRAYIQGTISVAGCDTFIVGGALGFDTIVAKEILTLKDEGQDVKLHVYVPCNNQSERWSISDKNTYNEILARADYAYMVDKPYYDGCMRERNYKMVDNASICICYYTGKTSGTSQTVNYAKRRNLQIFNVSDLKIKI